MAFAGVNFIDLYLRSGFYPSPSLPAIAGKEGAGVVDAVGPGVTSPRVGDRVAFFDGPGGYAEQVAIGAARALPVPAGLGLDVAAALPLQGMTARMLIETIGRVGAGDLVLVHAAAGGVGLLACQLARRAGARVFGTASTPAKAARARAAGCERVWRAEDDFASQILSETGGRGCDLVLDSVGRTTFAGSVKSTRVRGTLVLFGQSSGPVEPFSPRAVLGSRTLVTATLFDYLRDPLELAASAAAVFGAAARGELAVAIDRVLPLAEAAEAHRLLAGRATSGKLLLAVG
jgi:NADPH2:quinone reductase